MDDAALSLGAIDVSYSSSSIECTISRCKHASEEWVSETQQQHVPFCIPFAIVTRIRVHTTCFRKLDMNRNIFMMKDSLESKLLARCSEALGDNIYVCCT